MAATRDTETAHAPVIRSAEPEACSCGTSTRANQATSPPTAVHSVRQARRRRVLTTRGMATTSTTTTTPSSHQTQDGTLLEVSDEPCGAGVVVDPAELGATGIEVGPTVTTGDREGGVLVEGCGRREERVGPGALPDGGTGTERDGGGAGVGRSDDACPHDATSTHVAPSPATHPKILELTEQSSPRAAIA